MSHLVQLGETCVSAGGDMCLTFFSLVRHVSQLCDTVSHLFQLGETCVSPFSIPGSNTASAHVLNRGMQEVNCWFVYIVFHCRLAPDVDLFVAPC